MTSFTQLYAFKIHTYCNMDQYFIFLLVNNISLSGHTTFLSINGHLKYFHFLAIMNNNAMTFCVQVFVGSYFQISFRNGIDS